MRTPGYVLIAAVVMLTGCDHIFGVDPVPHFEAVIDGDTRPEAHAMDQKEYAGTGKFNSSNGPNSLRHIGIHSMGVGSSEGESISFHLYDHGAGMEGGSYEFDLLPHMAGNNREGLSGQYGLIRSDGAKEFYFIDGGELSFHAVDEDFLQGTFNLTGFLWCVHLPNGEYEGYCERIPSSFPADLPRTEASGSFGVLRSPIGVANPSDPAWSNR